MLEAVGETSQLSSNKNNLKLKIAILIVQLTVFINPKIEFLF